MRRDNTTISLDRRAIASCIARLDVSQSWRRAYDSFEALVLDLIRELAVKRVCQLGGGRTPMFTRDVVEALGLNYVVNDISAAELARAPAWVGKAQFNLSVQSLPEEHRERFDFVFSHMLMEHVSDAKQAYRNIHAMLRPGGAVFNFHPVLYSPALVLNWLMPEALTKRILLLLQPHRHDKGYPKFPAYYSYCVVGRKSETMLRGAGFGEFLTIHFYGNDYLKRVPALQRLEDRFSNYAMRAKKTYLSPLSYTLAAK